MTSGTRTEPDTADVPRAGGVAAVAVPVATLWTGPEDLRPGDGPAVRPRPDVPCWVGAMSPDARGDSDSPTLSQALRGETAVVEEIRDDEAGQPWARVVLTAQPAPSRDPRGYPGWMPVAHLTGRAPSGAEASHVVTAPIAEIRANPDGPVTARLIVGTRLVATPGDAGWALVAPVDGEAAGYVRADALAPLTPGVPDPIDFLAVATSLLGTPYVWGGLSTYGIDCSGLVHLAARRHGVTVPRDAHEQADATTPVVFGTERAGDVYFFARPGKRVHHVGFVAAAPDPDGTRHLLHACASTGAVVREVMGGDRLTTLVGVHRLPTA